jgi:hypothetical protein
MQKQHDFAVILAIKSTKINTGQIETFIKVSLRLSLPKYCTSPGHSWFRKLRNDVFKFYLDSRCGIVQFVVRSTSFSNTESQQCKQINNPPLSV